jgi:hypothetical protein
MMPKMAAAHLVPSEYRFSKKILLKEIARVDGCIVDVAAFFACQHKPAWSAACAARRWIHC